MKKVQFESFAYEAPGVEEIFVETSPVMVVSCPEYQDVGGGGMDNPSPEDPD